MIGIVYRVGLIATAATLTQVIDVLDRARGRTVRALLTLAKDGGR